MNELITLIMQLEGKKHQCSIGDVREVMKILADLLASDPHNRMLFLKYVNARKRKLKPTSAPLSAKKANMSKSASTSDSASTSASASVSNKK